MSIIGNAILLGGGGGGNAGVIITDTIDTHGGTIRTLTGTTISGTKSITSNGTGIDVASYAAVDVAVPISVIRTGSGAPSSSLGVDGDIYIQTS